MKDLNYSISSGLENLNKAFNGDGYGLYLTGIISAFIYLGFFISILFSIPEIAEEVPRKVDVLRFIKIRNCEDYNHKDCAFLSLRDCETGRYYNFEHLSKKSYLKVELETKRTGKSRGIQVYLKKALVEDKSYGLLIGITVVIGLFSLILLFSNLMGTTSYADTTSFWIPLGKFMSIFEVVSLITLGIIAAVYC